MAIETQSFTRFLPMETRFVVGENPSPSKLNGSFSQIENAFTILESFLGNGIDFHVTENDNRKLLFNISSAIGKTDKLYKPINLIPNLSFIAFAYGGDAVSYTNGELTFVTNALTVGIPVNAKNGFEIGIYYTGEGALLGAASDIGVWESLPATSGSEYKWETFIVQNNIKYFKLKTIADNGLKIKAIYVIDKSIYNGVFNKAYCLPLENDTYWSMKTPCKYAAPDSTQLCIVKTCDYCIGQNYEMDSNSTMFGQPKCIPYSLDAASGARWINSGNPVSISYTPEPQTINGNQNIRGTYLTIQSPILTIDNQYAIKFKPFHIHSLIIDTQIPTNLNIIYDTKNSSSTIKYLTNLYSAGGVNGNIRSDILYIKDTSEVSAGIGDQKRFLVLGGNYGLIDLMYDIIKFISIPVPYDAADHVAIYDE